MPAAYPYVWRDARYEDVRENRRVVSLAVVIPDSGLRHRGARSVGPGHRIAGGRDLLARLLAEFGELRAARRPTDDQWRARRARAGDP
ncbi:MAG: hypothetical protein HY329_06590 [Chloroflexi bacterium]|nr:hypothetical protein [Chloroflexota bacterium]